MVQLIEYLKMAIDNIRSNKGRSFLTMLGIIIGIGSVIMIMSIGQGVKSQMTDELSSIGGGQIYVYTNFNSSEEVDITPDDMESIKKNVDNVKGVTPFEVSTGTTKSLKGEFEMYANYGSGDLKHYYNQTLIAGRNISDADVDSANLVAVINQIDAMRLFGTHDVVGLTTEVTINNITKDVTIIGVRQVDTSTTFVSFIFDLLDFDLPYTAMRHFGMDDEKFSNVYIFAESAEYSSQVADDSINLLNENHHVNEDDAFMVQDISSQLDSINSILDMVTLFISLVAAISLLVGGIGVMNIMLVSVTERTREIGIRKALGARTGSIMLQFMAEAGIITLIGGIIGIAVGLAGGFGISALTGGMISARLSVSTILIATIFSSGVGLFFGIYPANRAAKLSPIEALRRN